MKLTEITMNEEILSIIKKNCGPFLTAINNQITDYPLYRGAKWNQPALLFEPLIRKTARLDDRRPKDTNKLKHARINDYFIRTFDEPFRNSVHVTGDEHQASFYGRVFMMFPIGEFTFLWSPHIIDIAFDIKWPAVGNFANVPPTQEVVDDVIGNLDYHTVDLITAIKSKVEIMIRCEEYYIILPSTFNEVTQ